MTPPLSFFLMSQEFKTLAGAQKRAAFETAHCNGRWVYSPVRCVKGKRDMAEINRTTFYTWRLERVPRRAPKAD